MADVPATVKELQRERMIAVLLEPASPYADQYSLTGVTVPDEGKLIVEIVGPGFDASDILRADIAPHERWEANLALMPGGRSADPIPTQRVHVVTQEQFSASVQKRLTKIGARLMDAAFPDNVLKKWDLSPSRLADEAKAYLTATRQNTLLKNSESYAAIPEKYVAVFARDVRKLLSGLAAYGIHLGPSSFAASVIPKRGHVFWDFFPARKQEAASLYPDA